MRSLTIELLVLCLIAIGEGMPVMFGQKSDNIYQLKDVARLLQKDLPMNTESLFLTPPQKVVSEDSETANIEHVDAIDKYQTPSIIKKRGNDEEPDIGKRVYLARIGKRQFYVARIG